MQQRTSLLLDLFPGDSFYPAGLNLMQAARDLLLPGGIRVMITVASKLEIKFPASSARSFSDRARAFCSRSWASWVMFKNYMPRLQLPVNITGDP